MVFNDVLYERDPYLSDEEDLERYAKRLKKNLGDFGIKSHSSLFVEAKFAEDAEGEDMRKINVQLVDKDNIEGKFEAKFLKRGVPKKTVDQDDSA